MDRRALLLVGGCLQPGHRVLGDAERGRKSSVRFAAAARFSAERGGAALIIVRNGVVLAEDYPSGGADIRWPLGAGTRAFAAAAWRRNWCRIASSRSTNPPR